MSGRTSHILHQTHGQQPIRSEPKESHGEHYNDSGAPGTVTFSDQVGDVEQTVLSALLKFVV
jgi:hypothetical protein